MAEAALEGVRVLELGDFISAAYGAKLLADLGADVIKVEPPEGDSARRQGPFPGDEPHPEQSGLHLFLNANKRSVTLDAATPSGHERLMELSCWADIVIHNLPPRYLEEHSLTYADLSRGHPELVMVSITTFGYDTPYRDWKGYALTANAASGLARRMGDPGRTPLWLPYCAADFQGGVHAAMTAMLARRALDLSGEGQHAWLSIVEVMGVVMAGAALAPYVFQGQLRERSGFHNPGFYPWQVVPVKDGYFEVITMVDEQWRGFVELMGDPAWGKDERLQNRWLAFQWAEELDAYWHPWMKERTKAELAATFAEHRIAFQPVHGIDEVVNADHLRTREFWIELEHPVAGRYTALGAPYRLSETPWAVRRPAPLLGQHNDEVGVELAGAGADRGRSDAGGERASLPVHPMQGQRVLDHGHVWAGPLLGSMFADMGAEVIKVQAPHRPSGVAMAGRAAGAAEADRDDPRAFHGRDRGKLSVTVDLAQPEGHDLYLSLVRVSDIVIENFAPRVMPGLGLDYRALSEANPRIIMASLSAAGATPGPWRELLTYGPSLSALYGIKSVQGYRGDPQPREDTADLDPTAAAHAFVAISAALEYRERSSRGQHIDLAQGEATMQRIAEPLMDYLFNGRVAGPQGNRYPGLAPHGIYRAAGDDRWLSIAVRDGDEWSALVALAADEAPQLGDTRFADTPGRLEHQDELDTVIERWTVQHDAMELARTLQAAGVAAFPVVGPPELLTDPNYSALRSRHVRVETESSLEAEQLYESIPWKLEATPGLIRLPTPRLGEHNTRIYGELLGLSTEALEELRGRDVI